MMKVTIVLFAAAVTLGSGLASAQAPASSPHKTAIDVTKAEIDAAVAKGIAALLPGVSVSDRLVNVSDMSKYNVAVAVVARPAGKDNRVLSHDKITEVYYVLKGSGTQVTGTLAGGTRQETSRTIGPGMSGDQPLQNARTGKLGPGDIQIIPPGVGHGWTSVDPGGIEYLVFRIDPEKVLALPN